jgi:hypothetical protein
MWVLGGFGWICIYTPSVFVCIYMYYDRVLYSMLDDYHIMLCHIEKGED